MRTLSGMIELLGESAFPPKDQHWERPDARTWILNLGELIVWVHRCQRLSGVGGAMYEWEVRNLMGLCKIVPMLGGRKHLPSEAAISALTALQQIQNELSFSVET